MHTVSRTMYDHFSRIATGYNELRTTDLEPVLFIKNTLKHLKQIKAADIGCGAGRYDLLFFKYLNNLNLTCIDINQSMLKETMNYLKSNGITHFKIMKSEGNDIPLKNRSQDCIFTFNVIHHFNFVRFIENAARVIKKAGYIFIYTRLRSQNARNIWGRYFPLFLEKEKRLFQRNKIETIINSTGTLTIESFKKFKYKRSSSLKQLLYRALNRHYSTFSIYSNAELEDSARNFQKNIMSTFSNPDNVEWFDENILFLLRHKRV